MSSKSDPRNPVSSRNRVSIGVLTSRPWSLAARLTAWYAGSAFLLLLGATSFLYWALVANLDREDDQILADKVHLLRGIFRDRPEDMAAAIVGLVTGGDFVTGQTLLVDGGLSIV